MRKWHRHIVLTQAWRRVKYVYSSGLISSEMYPPPYFFARDRAWLR